MQSWQTEVYRSLVQILYWRDYRYAEGHRGTLLDFECDIMADTFADDGPYAKDAELGNDWLRRYEAGGWSRKTGEYYYTVPRPDRRKAVFDSVEHSGLVTQAAIAPHTGDAGLAERIAAERGYGRFANQRILAGTFRGVFHGRGKSDEGMIESVLLVHFIPGERYFRTRLLRAYYSRHTGESDRAFKARIDSYNLDTSGRDDAFGSFGTNYGRIFGRSDDTDRHASEFAFDKKGRRVLAMTVRAEGDGTGLRLALAQKPAEIDRAIGLLYRIDEEMAPPLAAE